MLPLHPTSPKGTPIHPRLKKSGAFWAVLCNVLIYEYTLAFPEAALLLNQTGYYLYEHAQYEQAEPLYQRALAIKEQALGPNHPDTALSLNNLALLYDSQGNYEQAKPLYERALAIMDN